ncbi:O-antigen ligase family protein (plasmid) [Roseobacteraceae bacterium NS-SX3]
MSRAAAAPAPARGARGQAALARPWPVALLMMSFCLPFSFSLGPLTLSGYRLVLIGALVPVLAGFLQGRAGRVNAVDVFVFLFAFWSALSVAANEGLSRWELMGILQIEVLMPYLMARVLIRDLESYRYFARWYVAVVLFLLPFAVYESVTGQEAVLRFFARFTDAYKVVEHAPRLGLDRAQVSLPHPILFGMFCSAAFALAWLVRGGGWFRRLLAAGGVGMAVFMSLSSGAFLAVMVQIMLMAWQRVFSFIQRKWMLLGGFFAGSYLFIELFSNRSPAQIFAKFLTLNSASAWYRINQFNFAKDDVLSSPLFGIGFSQWSRPVWMLPSIDNFWLAMAVRYGLPPILFLLGAIIAVCTLAGRRPLEGALAAARSGFVFSLLGLSFAALSVHLWEAAFCLLMFLIGSGAWLIDAEAAGEGPAQERGTGRARRIRYTRFEGSPAE